MNQRIIPIVSAGIGLLAFVLTHQYLRNRLDELARERDKLYAGARQISVVVAKRDIPEGTTIQKSDLAKDEEFESAVRGHAVTTADANLILGRKTVFQVKKGEPIFWSDIEGGARAGRGLAPMVTPGMRAISLSVSGAAAVSGMVEPNDRIDVLGTFAFPSKTMDGEMESVTLTILQDVTVLATGTEVANQPTMGRQSNRRTGYNTVTVEATARETELLVFAQQVKGSLTLSLRNPADVSFEQDLPSVDFQQLETKLPELNLYRQRNIRHKRNL